jgi:hypothetical protein
MIWSGVAVRYRLKWPFSELFFIFEASLTEIIASSELPCTPDPASQIKRNAPNGHMLILSELLYSTRLVRITESGEVGFRLRISPRIRSQNRNGSKGCVSDLCWTDSCKKIKKSGSLLCPFKLWDYPYLWAREEEGEEQEGAESQLVWPEHPSFGTWSLVHVACQQKTIQMSSLLV